VVSVACSQRCAMATAAPLPIHAHQLPQPRPLPQPHLLQDGVDEDGLAALGVGEQVGVGAAGGVKQLAEDDAISHCMRMEWLKGRKGVRGGLVGPWMAIGA
jgi:hypothetical protein